MNLVRAGLFFLPPYNKKPCGELLQSMVSARAMNNSRYTYILLSLSLLLAACTGSQPVPKPGLYERAPIREVSEAQLAVDGMLIDAVALQESGRIDQALDAFAELTRKEPSCAAAWYEMSQLLLQRRWTDSALACATRATQLEPDNVWYLLALAQVQGQRSDKRALVGTWERLVALKPDVLEYYYELSNAYIATGDLSAAVEALNRVERKIGITEPVSLQKQRLWQAAGKDDKAAREIERLAESLPGDRRYNAMLAESYMQQRRYTKAKQCYDRILQTHPDDPYIHIQLAEYYKATSQPDKADEELLLAFRNRQLDTKSKLQLLTGFYTQEEFYGSRSATAFQLVDMAMADCQDRTELAAYYGNILMYRKRYADAARLFEMALGRDSSDYAVWERLLICLTELPDNNARTDACARRAAALFPTHTLPHFLMASTAMDQERYTDAVASLDNILRWGFSKGYLEAETHALMAEAAYRAGQYDKAWKAYDRYLTLKPDDLLMLNNYAYHLAEQGLQLEKALQMSRRTIEGEPDNANSLDTYAWILHRLGRNTEALPYAERAVKGDPSNATLRQHLLTIQDSLK